MIGQLVPPTFLSLLHLLKDYGILSLKFCKHYMQLGTNVIWYDAYCQQHDEISEIKSTKCHIQI
jgi:hypothetical protein